MVLLEQERADVKGQEYPDHLQRNVIIGCTHSKLREFMVCKISDDIFQFIPKLKVKLSKMVECDI